MLYLKGNGFHDKADYGPRAVSQYAGFRMLDLEVRRARRYQNFFSILMLKLSPLHGTQNDNELKACWKTMRELLAEELRESDILSFFGDDQWAVIIPYADLSAAGLLKSRLIGSLEHCGFRQKGYEIIADLICFPIDGTNTADLMGKL